MIVLGVSAVPPFALIASMSRWELALRSCQKPDFEQKTWIRNRKLS
jgi:hypothetical protein